MSFPYYRSTCFVCAANNLHPLLWLNTDGIPHGENGHQFAYSYKSIVICDSCGQAQLESYSHDCFSYFKDEDWDMWWWYVLDQTSTNNLRLLLSSCPNPFNGSCDCSLHAALGESAKTIWGGIYSVITPHFRAEAAPIKLEIVEGKPSFALRQPES